MPIQIELPDNQFNTVIRNIKQISIANVNFLRYHTFHTLKRLRVRRNLTKAITGIPDGSDHLNMQNIVVWMNKSAARTDQTELAVAQIVAIDATCCNRTIG